MKVLRACINCPEIWHGSLPCPKCGAPGEPLEEKG